MKVSALAMMGTTAHILPIADIMIQSDGDPVVGWGRAEGGGQKGEVGGGGSAVLGLMADGK